MTLQVRKIGTWAIGGFSIVWLGTVALHPWLRLLPNGRGAARFPARTVFPRSCLWHIRSARARAPQSRNSHGSWRACTIGPLPRWFSCVRTDFPKALKERLFGAVPHEYQVSPSSVTMAEKHRCLERRPLAKPCFTAPLGICSSAEESRHRVGIPETTSVGAPSFHW
jgi:hypothetical protein